MVDMIPEIPAPTTMTFRGLGVSTKRSAMRMLEPFISAMPSIKRIQGVVPGIDSGFTRVYKSASQHLRDGFYIQYPQPQNWAAGSLRCGFSSGVMPLMWALLNVSLDAPRTT